MNVRSVHACDASSTYLPLSRHCHDHCFAYGTELKMKMKMQVSTSNPVEQLPDNLMKAKLLIRHTISLSLVHFYILPQITTLLCAGALSSPQHQLCMHTRSHINMLSTSVELHMQILMGHYISCKRSELYHIHVLQFHSIRQQQQEWISIHTPIISSLTLLYYTVQCTTVNGGQNLQHSVHSHLHLHLHQINHTTV
jgi:hypothetical protein